MSKELIFISHSTPNDDYYAGWLASKLNQLGYKVWVDLKNLSAGDSFNTVIKPIIKNEARILIALTTESYCQKSDNQNSGVARELNCALTVDSSQYQHNFIIPIRFDAVPYRDFPYFYTNWKAIDFNENWKSGLIQLIEELDQMKIPKNSEVENPVALWHETIHSQNQVLKKNEDYYSTWISFKEPKNVFIHQLSDFYNSEIYAFPFPFIPESNCLITFSSSDTVSKYFKISKSLEVEFWNFHCAEKIQISDHFTLTDSSRKLSRLLNKCFEHNLDKRDMICWRRGTNKKKIYYFKSQEERDIIPLKRYQKPRGRRELFGTKKEIVGTKSYDVHWHFALYARVDLFPVPHYKLFYSVVFTDDQFKRYPKSLHHQFRRSVPSDWFNRKWFEMLLAALLKISPSYDSEEIEIEIDENKKLLIDNQPIHSHSDYGYKEPSNEE